MTLRTLVLTVAFLAIPAMAQAQEADQVYIDAMVPHDEVTVRLATDAAQKATHKQLRSFAQQLRTRTQRNISTLKGFRNKWYGSSATPTSQLIPTRQLPRGAGYDRLWMEAMILQDQSAIDLSRLGLYTLGQSDLKSFARRQIDTLTQDQKTLRGWIRAWYR